MTSTEHRLTEAEAAERLGLESPLELARWRTSSKGPPCYRADDGNVYYLKAEVIAWRQRVVYPPGELSGEGGAS